MNKHLGLWPADVAGLSFDDLYLEISDHWQDKSKRLQQRRWKMLKKEISGGDFGQDGFVQLKKSKRVRRSNHENVMERYI